MVINTRLFYLRRLTFLRASGNDPNTITNALSPGSSDGGPTRQAGCAVLQDD